MSELQGVLWGILALGIAAIVVAVCAQGRLKYWVLMAVGAIPRDKRPGLFGEIPRRERDWALVNRLNGLDGSREPIQRD